MTATAPATPRATSTDPPPRVRTLAHRSITPLRSCRASGSPRSWPKPVDLPRLMAVPCKLAPAAAAPGSLPSSPPKPPLDPPRAIGSIHSREPRGAAPPPALPHRASALRAPSGASPSSSIVDDFVCQPRMPADHHRSFRSRPSAAPRTPLRCCCYEELIFTLAPHTNPGASATRLHSIYLGHFLFSTVSYRLISVAWMQTGILQFSIGACFITIFVLAAATVTYYTIERPGRELLRSRKAAFK